MGKNLVEKKKCHLVKHFFPGSMHDSRQMEEQSSGEID